MWIEKTFLSYHSRRQVSSRPLLSAGSPALPSEIKPGIMGRPRMSPPSIAGPPFAEERLKTRFQVSSRGGIRPSQRTYPEPV
jgi:hypothetical protein